MNGYLMKALLIVGLLAGLPIMYFTLPSGDRRFGVIAWLAFVGIVGTIILRLPVLHCPHCGRATSYFDNYTERTDQLTGGRRRRIQCKSCHSIIDRLTGTVVARLPKAQGQLIIRLTSLLGTGIFLCTAGYCLVVVSIAFGALALRSVAAGVGIRQHAIVVLVGCGIALIAGLLLAAAGHMLRRRAWRLADESGMQVTKGLRIRK